MPVTHDYSAWGMFQSADIVVQSVMAGLVIASLVSWIIFFAKLFQLKRDKKSVLREQALLLKHKTIYLDKNKRFSKNTRRMLLCAQTEMPEATYIPRQQNVGVKERTLWGLEVITTNAVQKLTHGVGTIATIGAVAPFVGLFGTVWGIMNSFIGIAKENTTSLSVIAPGIAEALFATGLGLVAAIPAVIFNNILAKGARNYKIALTQLASTIMRIISQSLDMNQALNKDR